MQKRPDAVTIATAVIAFGLIVALRLESIGTRFWMLRDQIRDWSIALGPFGDLPLVGPATHVGGYTIGPAFYWILWAIRVTVGPLFQNLPHAGGIGQAILRSAADTLLLVAIWRRAQSPWIALSAVVLISTAAYDLCLAALVWNPPMSTTLATAATALVLLNWHRKSATQVLCVALLAWSAVHAYTGAIFVTVGVFAALLADPFARREWRAMPRNAAVILVSVALLQLPYVVHQVSRGFTDRAMGAVSGHVGQILSGRARPELAKSLSGYAAAVDFIQVSPQEIPFVAASRRVSVVGWALLICGGVLAVRYRHDPTLLAITILPPVTAIAGYALFLDDLDHYYYLSLMPAAVLTTVLAATAVPSPRLARIIAMSLLVGALALVPARIRFAATMHRMPEYGVLADASRKIRSLRQPMRTIRTDFRLPPTSDPEFLYKILGGRIDPASPWIAVITSDGGVIYQHVGGS